MSKNLNILRESINECVDGFVNEWMNYPCKLDVNSRVTVYFNPETMMAVPEGQSEYFVEYECSDFPDARAIVDMNPDPSEDTGGEHIGECDPASIVPYDDNIPEGMDDDEVANAVLEKNKDFIVKAINDNAEIMGYGDEIYPDD